MSEAYPEPYTGSDEFLAEIWNHTNVGVDNQEDWIDELSAIGVEGRQRFARTLRAAADALDAPTRHTPSVGSTSNNKKRPDGRARNDDKFDFTKYPSRHVALHVMYAGWEYKGFASQGAEQSGVATVEECLFRALKRVRLIAPDATWKNCDYTRCGRTDAGVSAVGQVVSAKLRCRVPFNDDGESEFDSTTSNESIADEDEIDYPATLNRALPQDIRVIGWAYVSPRFSARFACDFRHYKYFFANWGAGGLDFNAMNDAAGRLVGEHDYRNFCKMDAKNVHNYRRRINSCRVVTAADAHDDGARGAMGLGGRKWKWKWKWKWKQYKHPGRGAHRGDRHGVPVAPGSMHRRGSLLSGTRARTTVDRERHAGSHQVPAEAAVRDGSRGAADSVEVRLF